MSEIPPPPDSNDPQFRRSDGGVDWVAFRAAASAWAEQANQQETERPTEE